MVFKCQEDSYLKEFSSTVVTCSPAKFDSFINGKKTKLQGYEVVCTDTILFPEGGGQPYDTGYLNNVRVYQVLRNGDQAVHYVTDPLSSGDVVKQTIDWDRRFDHMQQHSGQHLISGVLEKKFNINTMSWWLGQEDSYIELDIPNMDNEKINEVENIVNELIRDSKNVTVQNYSKDTPAEDLEEARSTKGLPDDHVGDIRVITIEGLERNMCCGTHVTNLSQLQIIKLLHCEKSKRKDQCLLHFLVGNRVLKRLSGSLAREQQITSILNNGIEQHVNLIDKLSKSMRLTSKNYAVALKAIAALEAEKIKSSNQKYVCIHRKEGDQDFVNTLIREVGDTNIFLCITTGDEKGSGNLVLYGEEKVINDVGKRICESLSGKGAGKGTRFQAKVSNLTNLNLVKDLLNEYFK